MSEQVKINTFADLMERGVLEIGDGYRAKLEELGGDGPFFLRAGLLVGQGFDWASAERFRADVFPKVRSKIGQPGDTMVTTKGNSVGRTAYVPPGAPEFVYSPHLSYWRSADSSRLSSGFLRYWSRSREFLAQLEAMAHGTDMAPYLSLADQRRLHISLPPIFIQEAIAEVLGSLDDKIAVNDLVNSKASMLLGAHFSVEAREVVRKVKLGDLIDLKYGKALKEEGRTLGRIPVFGGNGISGWHDIPLTRGPGIIIGRKGANAGSVSWSQGPYWAIDTSFYVEPVSCQVPLEFLFFLMQNIGLRKLVGDSAIPGLNRNIALSCDVGLPPDDVIKRFSVTAKTLLSLSAHIADESRTLGELRDTLQPRLMSGEIRVRDAEKVVEEVT
jgi:type I restriction enzyme S subunit